MQRNVADRMPGEDLRPRTGRDDQSYARGIAYEGIVSHIQFCINRRVNIAYSITTQGKAGLLAWFAAFGTAKGLLPSDMKSVIGLLEVVFLWLPIFAMIETIVLVGAARSVYQDEINYIVPGLHYENAETGGFGVANTRYNEIVSGSYWRPSTAEAAGIGWFFVWLAFALVSRYFTL